MQNIQRKLPREPNFCHICQNFLTELIIEQSKGKFAPYLFLTVLIQLGVFGCWIFQENQVLEKLEQREF